MIGSTLATKEWNRSNDSSGKVAMLYAMNWVEVDLTSRHFDALKLNDRIFAVSHIS